MVVSHSPVTIFTRSAVSSTHCEPLRIPNHDALTRLRGVASSCSLLRPRSMPRISILLAAVVSAIISTVHSRYFVCIVLARLVQSSAARKPAAGKKTAAAKAASSRKQPTSTSSSSKPSANAPKPGSFHDNHSHLFTKQPRNYGIGRAIPPKRDLTRFVKWPRYIRIQRQRAILKRRLKVPPAINQFSRALDKNQGQSTSSNSSTQQCRVSEWKRLGAEERE